MNNKHVKLINDASPQVLDTMMAEIANGASFYSVGKKYGYHRESIKRAWVKYEEKKRIKLMADETKKRNAEIHVALQELTPSTQVSVIDQKVDIAFEMAMNEFIIRLSENNAKALSDKDLISACKLLFDIRRVRDGKIDDDRSTHKYTQNIVNIFSEAIKDTIKTQNYAKES